MRKGRGMKRHPDGTPLRLGRRQLLVGTGAAAAVIGAGGAVGRTRPATAAALQRALPAPLPIPGGVDAPSVGFIHIFLPGPEGAVTPFFRIPALGLDVEPSTLTDYRGFTTFAVLAGQAEGSDGNTYNVEFDVRVMRGVYIAEDGSRQRGTFAFF